MTLPSSLWRPVAQVALVIAGCSLALGADDLTALHQEPRPTPTVRAARVNTAAVREGDPDWLYARSEIFRNNAELKAAEVRLAKEGLGAFVLRHGVGPALRVALTFDDGPHPAYTPRLLEILRKKNVKATFLVVGYMAERYPDLVRQIAAEGHAVGNHTYSHATMTKLPPGEASIEYKANNDVIRRLTGKRARYCRPPGGDLDDDVLLAAATLGLTTVLWTDDPGDYDNPGPSVLFQRETQTLHPGGIILLHDGSVDTLNTLGKFIDSVQARGYRFVTLDELRRPSPPIVERPPLPKHR
jgi:peptidoglycan/xylan/chitin deacetylase (PgdA/CDA1 family)